MQQLKHRESRRLYGGN